MGILNRFRKPRVGPLAVGFERDVWSATGPVTASEAAAHAVGLLVDIDPHAYPVHVSTASMDLTGKSDRWEVGFDSRSLVASLWVTFASDRATIRGVPHVSRTPGMVMPDLWDGMNHTQRAVFEEQWFTYQPLKGFVDSHAAVEQILAAHEDIDLTSDLPDVSLATDRADELWALTAGGRQWWTPLF